MEASTTIREMVAGNKISVPTYQRAYSWETPKKPSNVKTQTDVFLSDLEEHHKRHDTDIPYYFGHFIFEEKAKKTYHVIDGQQRLTTIIIFLSALYKKLKSFRAPTREEQVLFEDMIERLGIINFSTVEYDDQLFKDYVIKQTKVDRNGLCENTESARCIMDAFDYFHNKLENKPEHYLTAMLSALGAAACTTHIIKDQIEAIQMFIFQNNRGKRPTTLEIVKAQFMYNVHLSDNGHSRNDLIREITNRFEHIYKSISFLGHQINEDDVLLYTLRVHFNSLSADNAAERIDKKLTEEDSLNFIREFTQALATSFGHLTDFYGKDERENFEIHSLISLGGIGICLPFIIKAYKYNLPMSEKKALARSLEKLVLRHRVIGTRAYMEYRINDEYKNFTETNPDTCPIIEHIEWLTTVLPSERWWFAYWSNENLEQSLQGKIEPKVARFLLWRYEVYLGKKEPKSFNVGRFDQYEFELEHIAPTTEPLERPHGYADYDENLRNQYVDCLGNYLLLSKSHNCSVGNVPFWHKHKTYVYNHQQREIQNMVAGNGIWGRELIERRKDKIIDFILKCF